MPLDSSYVAPNFTDLYQYILSQTSGKMFAIGLNEQPTATLVTVIADLEDPPMIRVLVQESVLKWFRNDFLLASTAADAIDAGHLSLRSSDNPFTNILLVTEEMVVSIVTTSEYVAGSVINDAGFVRNSHKQWSETWHGATEFSLRTPARSRIYETLAEEIGPEIEADVRRMLNAIDTIHDKERLDEVMITLLAAAKHEVQFYEISKWGEDIGFASKATFSQRKIRLEEHGLIDTEKVPIEVGRPRLRLLLGDERFREADVDEFVSIAQNILSPAPN